MKIHVEQIIEKPIEDVWQVFGHEFADIYRWSSFVQSSVAKADGPLIGDATISGRNCETKLGTLDETIEIFSNESREISFLVKSDGFPFFLRSIHSHWRFFEAGTKTRAQTDVTLDVAFPFNVLVGWSLRRSFTKAIKDVGGEMGLYMETRPAA